MDGNFTDLEELTQGTEMVPDKPSISKVRYSHEDMVDCLIANPQISQGQLAIRYGYTQAWVSIILSSDAFKELLVKRRQELCDPVLLATIEDRYAALAAKSCEVLLEKLSLPAVSDTLALRAAELGAKAMGLGGERALPPTDTSGALERLANRLIDLNRNRSIEHEGNANTEV